MNAPSTLNHSTSKTLKIERSVLRNAVSGVEMRWPLSTAKQKISRILSVASRNLSPLTFEIRNTAPIAIAGSNRRGNFHRSRAGANRGQAENQCQQPGEQARWRSSAGNVRGAKATFAAKPGNNFPMNMPVLGVR